MIADRGESQGIMSSLGRRGDSCKGRESQSVMLCSGSRDDSGQSRRAW